MYYGFQSVSSWLDTVELKRKQDAERARITAIVAEELSKPEATWKK